MARSFNAKVKLEAPPCASCKVRVYSVRIPASMTPEKQKRLPDFFAPLLRIFYRKDLSQEDVRADSSETGSVCFFCGVGELLGSNRHESKHHGQSKNHSCLPEEFDHPNWLNQGLNGFLWSEILSSTGASASCWATRREKASQT